MFRRKKTRERVRERDNKEYRRRRKSVFEVKI